MKYVALVVVVTLSLCIGGCSGPTATVSPQDIKKHDEAFTELKEKNDYVVGEYRRIDAVVDKLLVWYTINENNPDALALRAELKDDLLEFDKHFKELAEAEKRDRPLLSDVEYVTAFSALHEIDMGSLTRKITRLRGMGFRIKK